MPYSVLMYKLYCVDQYETFLTQFALNLNGTFPGTVSVIDLAGSGIHLMLMYP